MFIRFKKFLMQQRILTYIMEEESKVSQQIDSLPFKQIHLNEKWDESHRDQEHPDIQKSLMWHLSKAVGKQSLAPSEMVKHYLSDPSVKQSTDAYTFDKQELEKLQ